MTKAAARVGVMGVVLVGNEGGGRGDRGGRGDQHIRFKFVPKSSPKQIGFKQTMTTEGVGSIV